MKLISSSSNPTVSPVVFNVVKPILHGDAIINTTSDKHCRTTLISKLNVEKPHSSTNSKDFLSIETIQKMINQLLGENKICKKRLAEILEITAEDLEQLILATHYADRLIPKINLSLIKLYCKTRFEK